MSAPQQRAGAAPRYLPRARRSGGPGPAAARRTAPGLVRAPKGQHRPAGATRGPASPPARHIHPPASLTRTARRRRGGAAAGGASLSLSAPKRQHFYIARSLFSVSVCLCANQSYNVQRAARAALRVRARGPRSPADQTRPRPPRAARPPRDPPRATAPRSRRTAAAGAPGRRPPMAGGVPVSSLPPTWLHAPPPSSPAPRADTHAPPTTPPASARRRFVWLLPSINLISPTHIAVPTPPHQTLARPVSVAARDSRCPPSPPHTPFPFFPL